MEVLRNLFEGYPNLWGGGVAHSVLILSLTIAFGIILAKSKCGEYLWELPGYSLSESYSVPFQHESGRTPAPLSKRIRIDSVCLLNWFAGRTRLFSAFKRGLYHEYASYARSSIRSNHYYYPALHHRNSDYHNGRYFVRSRHQYSGTGSRTTITNSDLNGIDAPEIAFRICSQLSAGCSRYHPFPACFEISPSHQYCSRRKEAEVGLGHLQELTVRPISIEVRNESVDGIGIKELRPLLNRKFVISASNTARVEKPNWSIPKQFYM